MSEALEKPVHSSAPEGTRSRARRPLCRAPVTRGSLGSALRPKSRRPYAREGAGGSWIPLAGPHREVAGTCRRLHGGRRSSPSTWSASIWLSRVRRSPPSARWPRWRVRHPPPGGPTERWEEGMAQAHSAPHPPRARARGRERRKEGRRQMAGTSEPLNVCGSLLVLCLGF